MLTLSQFFLYTDSRESSLHFVLCSEMSRCNLNLFSNCKTTSRRVGCELIFLLLLTTESIIFWDRRKNEEKLRFSDNFNLHSCLWYKKFTWLRYMMLPKEVKNSL